MGIMRFGAAVGTACVMILGSAAPVMAATVGREGSELVLRDADAQSAKVTVFAPPAGSDAARFRTTPAMSSAGTGCAPFTTPAPNMLPESADGGVECSLMGVSAISLLLGDGNDNVAFEPLPVPIRVDLGAGDDDMTRGGAQGDGPRFGEVGPGGATVTGGPGNDRLTLSQPLGVNAVKAGPVTLSGGDGNDRLSAFELAGAVIDGGPGDDVLSLRGSNQTIICGPGADRLLSVGGDGRVGAGCAPHVSGLKNEAVLGTYSVRAGVLSITAGRLDRSARLRVSVVDPSLRRSPLLASRTVRARAGRLRVRMPLTRRARFKFKSGGRQQVTLGFENHTSTGDSEGAAVSGFLLPARG